jgi:protein-S-isoprenylcysteine O-methyltransferase Ste14
MQFTVLLILALWIIWAVYWFVAARSVKPTARRQGRAIRLIFLVQLAVAAVLLAPHRWTGWLASPVIPGGWYRYWCAVAVIAAGLLVCIWARRTLAGNWSGNVTVKVGHELVQSGPYRWIRHPIYAGLLMMILGTAAAGGRVHGLLAFALAAETLWIRSRLEERWMAEEFGERYALYRKHSWALVPFIL